MHFCKLDHVRILNLSDIRNTKSGDFYFESRRLQSAHGYFDHSLFSDGRQQELGIKLMRKKEAPLVLAWGVDDALSNLAEQCAEKIKNEKRKIGYQRHDGKYYHAKPTTKRDQETWVTEAVKLIRE